MSETVYPNGVREITGNKYGSDYRMVVIPSKALRWAGFYYAPWGDYVENVPGDFTANISPYDENDYHLTQGFKHSDKTVAPYESFIPFGAYTIDHDFIIDNREGSWNILPHAAQVFRYLIRSGLKNHQWDDDENTRRVWDGLEPRRLIASNINGDTIVISVKGNINHRGWTLHECVEFAFDTRLGIIHLIDGDSGSSVQDCLVVSGQKKLFQGDLSGRRPGVGFLTVFFKEPLRMADSHNWLTVTSRFVGEILT